MAAKGTWEVSVAKTVRIPVLGQSVEEVRIVRWLRSVGDAVEAGAPIAEVETDKTNIEWESPESGTLLAILIPEGAYAAVEAPALVLGEPGETVPEISGGSEPAVAPAVAPAPVAPSAPGIPPVRPSGASGPSGAVFSPSARRLADELGLGADELSGIVGSGPKGRVIERDITAVHAAL
ncbi:MAG: biotin/lipoyl-containing protein [Armatimonadota bacterium]